MPTRTLYELDHIIPVSRWRAYVDGRLVVRPRDGEREPNHLDNFAWTCPYCNGSKGNRVSGRAGQRSVGLFHPRRDRWDEHFVLRDDYLYIRGMTDIGRATESILAFNDNRDNGPLSARHKARLDGIYPPPWARAWGY